MEIEILAILKTIQNSIVEIKTDISTLKEDVKCLKKDVEYLKGKSDSIEDQTANLTEFKTSVIESLKSLNDVTTVTKENCYEICKLKAIK